jgi:phosphohistidine phosphatase
MRHGEATLAADNPRRPLTDSGRDCVMSVVNRAAAEGAMVENVYHSGILRARQTAEILGRRLKARHVGRREGLDPDDPVEPVALWLFEQARSHLAPPLAVVGHLPFVERLAGRLVEGDQARIWIPFTPGALARLQAEPGASRFSLDWLIDPQRLPSPSP